MACRRSTSTASRSLALRISVLTCWLRSDRTPVTSPALASRSPSVSLRLLSDRDSRVSPSNVGPSCGAIWSMVADSVSSDWLSDAVSVPAALRGEFADRVGQRVRRGRAGDRDDVGWVQRPAARRFQGQHPLAEQRPGPDVRGGLRPERVLAVDGEGDQRLAVLQRDVGDRADFDARQRHVVAGGQAARLGEQRLVPQRRRPLDESRSGAARRR